MVDAILLIGENSDSSSSAHLSEFSLYVGFDQSYENNVACSVSPYLPYTSDTKYGTFYENLDSRGTEWQNGVEAWCNLPGNYVSFVRESTAQPSIDNIVICTFGVIADPSVSISSTRTTKLSS